MKTSDIVEIPETIREAEGAGCVYGGIYGERTMGALADRQKRTDNYRERVNFRECLNCDRCTHCLEIRGFYRNGKEYVKTYLCLTGEFETTPYHTCDRAQRNRRGRRKVVYDLANAPRGFEVGRGSEDNLRYREPGESIKESGGVPPEEGYRGGSKFYRRRDGDEEAEGSGKIPRGLTN